MKLILLKLKVIVQTDGGGAGEGLALEHRDSGSDRCSVDNEIGEESRDTCSP